ncbi:hypothetical protein [Pedobacter sandarakinus]|uniref:hypothetical protein n=1 Tax=Pedobacter sandarakinus TaxID=353156 RepID=UPI002246E793|nr:hypothetical protein [Pedobacter sandarakinus]MCX2574098.1 hypothetical protein [Pedobacter sandarakinus]
MVKRELLSENIKDFMDYAIDTIKLMDGAPEHSEDQQQNIETRLSHLSDYLNNVKVSYLENVPKDDKEQVDMEYIAQTGHS